MALNAGVVRGYVVHLCRIEDVGACGMGDVFAARTMAAFAADVPFRNLLGVNIVVDGMAAITGWACRSLRVVRRIEGCPPVGACIRDVILEPLLVVDVPLSGQRIVVIAYLREVALLPDAAVNQGHLLLCELRDVVRAQVRDDRVRMFSWIAHYIRHRRLLPMFVDVRMAFLARLRAGVVCRSQRTLLNSLFFSRRSAETSDVRDELPTFRGG